MSTSYPQPEDLVHASSKTDGAPVRIPRSHLGGKVDTVAAGDGVTVDATDPTAPAVALALSTDPAQVAVIDPAGKLLVPAGAIHGVQTLTAADGTVTVAGTGADPTVKVALSTDPGNELTTGADGGLYAATGTTTTVSAADATVTVTHVGADYSVQAALSADAGQRIVHGTDGKLLVTADGVQTLTAGPGIAVTGTATDPVVAVKVDPTSPVAATVTAAGVSVPLTGVQSLTAADATVVVAGTASAPTAKVGVVPAAQVSVVPGGTLAAIDAQAALLELDAKKVQKAAYPAKGALLAATAAATPTAVAVGTDGQVLTADTASAAGVKWATPASGTAIPLAYGRMVPAGFTTVVPTVGAPFPAALYAAPTTLVGMTAATTGSFTVTAAGVYNARASVCTRSATGGNRLGIYVNGTLAVSGPMTAAAVSNADLTVPVDAFVTLAAGDEVSIRMLAFAGSSWSLNDFVLSQVPTATTVPVGSIVPTPLHWAQLRRNDGFQGAAGDWTPGTRVGSGTKAWPTVEGLGAVANANGTITLAQSGRYLIEAQVNDFDSSGSSNAIWQLRSNGNPIHTTGFETIVSMDPVYPMSVVADLPAGAVLDLFPLTVGAVVGTKRLGTGSFFRATQLPTSTVVDPGLVPVQSHFQFSLAEQLTGEFWIDGRPVYRRTFDCGAVAGGTTLMTLPATGMLIGSEGQCFVAGPNQRYAAPFHDTTHEFLVVLSSAGALQLTRGGVFATPSPGNDWITVRYVK